MLRELWLFSPEKRRLRGILSVPINTWRDGAKRMESCFLWCPVTGPQAMCTTWKTGGSLWTSRNMFLLWGWHNTGTVFPEKLWSLHPWRYSKAAWRRSWATDSMWPCWSRGLDRITFRGACQPQPVCDSELLPRLLTENYIPRNEQMSEMAPNQSERLRRG